MTHFRSANAQLGQAGASSAQETAGLALARTDYIAINGSGPRPATSGANAIAIGTGADASGADSVAMGTGAVARGGAAVSIGAGNIADGNGAVAIGDPNVAARQDRKSTRLNSSH